MSRQQWAGLSDDQLLAQCEVDTYRASGPGGQKRNKTSSAVRLRHPPSGLLVIAEESRSQHENKARALRRLRQALFLKLREPVAAGELAAERLAARADFGPARDGEGRLHLGARDPRFWPAVGVVLDVLEAVEGRLSEAAAALGTTTANLGDFLKVEDKVWEQANQLRARYGHKAAVRIEPPPRAGEGQGEGLRMTAPHGFSWIERPNLAALARPNSQEELNWLRQQGIQVLISLTEDPLRREWVNEAGLMAFHEPLEDMEPPSQEQLDRAVSALRRALARGLPVAVHCGAGLGRTGVVLAAYFVSTGLTAQAAIAKVRKLRPHSIETDEQAESVEHFARRQRQRGDEAGEPPGLSRRS